jgi:hypothetical protein
MSPKGEFLPQKIETTHEIGLITALKLVAIFWAGAIPIVFPAWLIVKAEITESNRLQDEKIAAHYVSKQEQLEMKQELYLRLEQNAKRLDELKAQIEQIARNQQKVLVKLRIEP